MRARANQLASDPVANAAELRALLAELDGDDGPAADRAFARARALTALALGGDAVLAGDEDPDGMLGEAVSAALEAGSSGLAAYAAEERARLAGARGDAARAHDLATEALAIEGLGASRTVSLALFAAESAAASGRLPDADAHLTLARGELDTLGPDWPYATTCRESAALTGARVALGRGLPDRAAELLDEAAASADARAAADRRASIEIERANLWLSSSRHALLESHVDRWLADGLFTDQPDRSTRLRLCLATSLVVRGRRDAAAAGRARALLTELLEGDGLRAIDRPRSLLRLSEAHLALGEAELAAARLAEVDALATELPRFERTLRAMLAARVALALGGDGEQLRPALTATRAAVDALIDELARDGVRAGGTGVLHLGERRGLVSALIELHLACDGPEAGARAALEVIYALEELGSHNRRLSAASGQRPALDALELGAGVGVLLYLPSISGSHLLSVDDDGVRHHALAPVAELTAAREAFQKAFDPLWPPIAWKREARALSDALLPADALARVDAWSTVLVVGMDLLRYVPFELLPLADGTLLGDRCAVGFLPDLPLAAHLARRPERARAEDAPSLALVAAPDFGARELAAIPLEAADRRALTRGARTTVEWSGRRADLAGLLDAAASGSDVLHVVTHGVADPEGARSPGLAVAGDPPVALRSHVETLTSCPPIVVLSACRAARGPGRLGEGGLEGLVGAFLERGATCVLVAWEDVEYNALLELIADFQIHLFEDGDPPALALARAQRAMRARHPDRPAAALLHAIGAGQRPLRE